MESIELREQWLLHQRGKKKEHISAQTETRDKTSSSALLSHALSCHLDMPSIQLLISIGLPQYFPDYSNIIVVDSLD